MGFFKDYSGRIVFITGAGKGLGRAMAQRFYDGNAEVVIIAELNYDLGQQTAKEIDPSGKRVVALKCDVSKPEDVNIAVNKVYDQFGNIHILVNNAGIIKDSMFHKMSYEQFDDVLKVHLYGTFNTCRAIVPKMREQGYGRIVNIASTAAFGNPGQCNYSAAKNGIIGFSRTLAKEVISKGITVNVVAPGTIDTDMLRSMPAESYEAARKRQPSGRFGDPDELAAVVAFLCTEDASYISGQTVTVSAAYTTQG